MLRSQNGSAFLSGENGANDATAFQGLLRRWSIKLHTKSDQDPHAALEWLQCAILFIAPPHSTT
jgi:hypothetical protein